MSQALAAGCHVREIHARVVVGFACYDNVISQRSVIKRRRTGDEGSIRGGGVEVDIQIRHARY